MIAEIEPQYMKDFRESFEEKLFVLTRAMESGFAQIRSEMTGMATKEDLKQGLAELRSEMTTRMDTGFEKVHSEISDLRDEIRHIRMHMVTQDEFEPLVQDVRDLKHDVHEIMKYIGRYEVRTQNLEGIILEDHKPRIVDLENIVYRTN